MWWLRVGRVRQQCVGVLILALATSLPIPTQSLLSADTNNLLALKDKFIETYPDALSTWSKDSDPCGKEKEWQGTIVCDGDGRVTTLTLTNELLRGPIPGPELATLRSLQRLDLGYNVLTGSIPLDLAALTALTYLSFEGNQITGGIPDFIAAFTNLAILRLSNNELNGSLTPAIGGLPNLKQLDIGSNSFSGELPLQISKLSNLQYLSIPANKFSGQIPTWIGALHTLRILEMYANDFEGSIPTQLGDAVSLASLALDENKLTGSLPASLGNLQYLNAMYIASNKLEGPIPQSFSQLKKLQYIDISYNEALNGSLPDFFGDLSLLESLAFEYCSLSGAIPSTLGRLSKLVEVFLDNNLISGTLPESLGQLQSLNKLYFNRNSIQGSIPTTLCQLTNIIELNLARNQLDGPISNCLMGLPKLTQLIVSYNMLSGPVPAVSNPDSFHFQYVNNCLENAPNQLEECKPTEGADAPEPPSKPRSSAHLSPADSGMYSLAIFVVLLVLVVIFVVLIIIAILVWHQHKAHVTNISRPDKLPVTEYSISKIKKATRNFSSVYGKGSFGTVYLAEDFLRDQADPRAIIKRAHDPQKLGEFLFKCKVEVLARARHRYLVNLLGYCVGKGERILVYEYLSNGTLFDRLHRPELEPLPWETRVKIAVNIACALEHLHHGVSPPLIHRAVTSSNILLSSDMSAKLSDFGLARGSGGTSTAFEDAPRRKKSRSHRERGDSGQLSLQMEKVDVYGFGVVLLELITGQKAMKEVHITSVAAPFLEDPQMMPLMVDPQLGGYFNQSELIELGSMARECVQDDAAARPSMRDVLQIMEERLRVDSHLFDNYGEDDSLTDGYSAALPPTANGYARASAPSTWTSLESFAQSIKNVLVSPRGPPPQSIHQDPPDLEMSSLLVMSSSDGRARR